MLMGLTFSLTSFTVHGALRWNSFGTSFTRELAVAADRNVRVLVCVCVTFLSLALLSQTDDTDAASWGVGMNS